MTPSRFRQIEQLYHAAREREASERASFLGDACAGDEELRRDVESLLAQDISGAHTLAHGPWESAAAETTEEDGAPRLAAGSEIGSYRIESQIGEGGMGVVYKALDTKLNRPVAVKLLSGRLADAAARRRFQREAQMASSLNHPHILTVYDAGEHDGQQYLATEYIDGGTLHEWSKGGKRTWREIVELLAGVADGLATAHEAKILHRDIKPANILVMKSGYAKLADFGLAKLAQEAPIAIDRTKTLSAQTGPGMVMGTVPYMSPEQAQGKATDARSDIFSFGVVLYELLADRRPFDGESDLETLQKVIHAAPPPLGETAPAALQVMVEKALRKDPAERYQSMREMVADLRMLARGSDQLALSTHREAAVASRSGNRRTAGYSVAAAILLLAGAAAWYFRGQKGPVAIPSEFVQLTNFSDYATAPAISRDGTMLTFFRGGSYFLGMGQVYVKLLSSGESKQLTDDPFQKYGPVFSSDGSRVVYTVMDSNAGKFVTWAVPVLGGPPSPLMNNAAGLSWIGPDRILFSEVMPGTAVHMGIVTARESRAEERRIYFPVHERGMAHYSYPSPDLKSVLVVEMDKSQDWQPCRLVPFDGTSPGSLVGPRGACTAAGWSPDGKWMYFNVGLDGGTHLWRQRFPNGSPEQITFGPTEEDGLAVTPDGNSLITSLGLRQSSVWLKDAGGDHRLPAEGPASQPKFSADGQRLYYLVNKSDSAESVELWVRDLASGKTNPVLTGQSIREYDISPDQSNFVFTVKAGGSAAIFMAAMDRSSPPRLLVRNADEATFSGANDIVFRELGEKANYLARIHADGTGLARISEAPIAEKSGTSPDGAWASVGGWNETVKEKGMYVVSLRDRSSRFLSKGPCLVQWSSDGKFLFVSLSHSAGDRRNSLASSGRTLVIPLPRGVAEAAIPANGLDALSDQPPNGIQMIRQWFVAPGSDASKYAYEAAEFQGNLFRIPLHSN